MFSFRLNEKKPNKQWRRLPLAKGVFGLQQTIHHSQPSIANRNSFVIFLIPLLWGHESKESLLISNKPFPLQARDYLNCFLSCSLPFVLSTWKSTELILSTVREYWSHITHINYFIS